MGSEVAPQYVYLAYDLASGNLIDEIPFSDVSFTSELNKVTTFSGKVAIEAPEGEKNRITESALSPAKTVIWVLSNGVPIWGGIIWSVNVDLSQRSVVVTGKDFWSYFYMRILTEDRNYTGSPGGPQSTAEIAADLIQWAQSVPGGDIGMTIDVIGNGPSSVRNYFAYEYSEIGELVDNLSAVINGFDYAMEYSGDIQSGFVAKFTMSYPFRGKDAGLVFDADKNIQLLSRDIEGDEFINRSHAFNVNNDRKVYSQRSNPLDGYPLLEASFSHANVVRFSTMELHALADLVADSQPKDFISVEVDVDDSSVGLGTFVVGDIIRVIAKYGYLNIDKKYKVMSYKVSIDENNLDTLEVSLADARLFYA